MTTPEPVQEAMQDAGSPRRAQAVARLAAVQALYQHATECQFAGESQDGGDHQPGAEHQEGGTITPLAMLLDQFHQHRLGQRLSDYPDDAASEDDGLADDPDVPRLAAADIALFDAIVTGTLARLDVIDAAITARLAAGWRLERLDRTMLQILRAGAWELIARPEVATATVINDYVNVAHAFFPTREVKFANGVLDALARAARAEALKA